MQRIAVLLLAVALAGIVAGCGGSTTAPPQTTVSGTGTLVSRTTCLEFAGFVEQIAAAISPTPSSASAGIKTELRPLQLIADTAPADIRNDFDSIVSAFTNFSNVVASSGYTIGSTTTPTAAQLRTIATAANALDTPKLKAAEQRLTAWANGNCK